MMGRLRDDLPNLPVLDLGTPFWLFSGNFELELGTPRSHHVDVTRGKFVISSTAWYARVSELQVASHYREFSLSRMVQVQGRVLVIAGSDSSGGA